jgi:hypothetical protein
VPPVFTPYQHNDARKSFDEVTRFILRSVDEGVPDTVQHFAFTPEDEAFRLESAPEWTAALGGGRGVRLAIGIRSDAGDEQAIQWGENCVIGSRSTLPSLLSRRVLGTIRQHVDRVGELQPPHGLYLFELLPAPGDIVAGEDLMVYGGSGAGRPDAVFLYVFDREGEPEGV